MPIVRLDVLGLSITIQSNDGEILESISQVFPGGEVTALSRVSPDLSVVRASNGTVRLEAGGQVESLPVDVVLAHAEVLVTFAIVRKCPQFVFCHAASVYVDGGAILLMGATTSGKTTLSLALRQRGCAALADDYTPVEVNSLRLFPFRTASVLRPHTRRLVHSGLLPAQYGELDGSLQETGCPVHTVIFLQLSGNESASADGTSPARFWRALRRLAGADGDAWSGDGNAIRIQDETAFQRSPSMIRCTEAEAFQSLMSFMLPLHRTVTPYLQVAAGLIRCTKVYSLQPGYLDETADIILEA